MYSPVVKVNQVSYFGVRRISIPRTFRSRSNKIHLRRPRLNHTHRCTNTRTEFPFAVLLVVSNHAVWRHAVLLVVSNRAVRRHNRWFWRASTTPTLSSGKYKRSTCRERIARNFEREHFEKTPLSLSLGLSTPIQDDTAF